MYLFNLRRFRLVHLFGLWCLSCVVMGHRVPTVLAAESSPNRQRPNILFIFSDDHTAQAIGAYGSVINTTPHIDRLASEGMLFRNCFCTNSICAPSRAVVLTGKHSHLNGVANNRDVFDGAQQTLPKLLQSHGYQTAIFGKWHLKSEPTGFDAWEVLPGQGEYYNPGFRTPDGPVQYTGYVTDIVTDRTLDWLENRRDPNKPFLLMSQHKAPHRNWMPGPDHLTMYDDTLIPEPPTLFDDYQGRSSWAGKQEMTIAEHMRWDTDLKVPPTPDDPKAMHDRYARMMNRLTPEQRARWDAAYGPKNEALQAANLSGTDLVRWQYQRYLKDYLRCVASIDDNVGRLLEYLDRTGLAENTIVVYSSDQGFYLGEHGWYDKRWMYEESLRMPLIVRWPGVVDAGSTDTHLVQNLDFAQTLLEAAGASEPTDMQGRSLAPLLKGQSPADWRRSIYYHYTEYPAVHMVTRHHGLRTDRYKLIHYYLSDEWELFDLQRDPTELRSLYDHPFYADTVRELKTELARLREHYGDTAPTTQEGL